MFKFQRKSINFQLRWMAGVVSVAFFLICLLISYSIREAVYENEKEHTRVTAQKLQNQLDLIYHKMQAFSINLCEDEGIQTLFLSSMSERATAVLDMEEKLIQYQILEPQILDISLAGDSVHYSRLYDYDHLDRMGEQIGQTNFRWLGVMQTDYAGAPSAQPVFVYAGAVYQDGGRIGAVMLSLDSAFLETEEDSESSYYALISGQGELLFSVNGPKERERELLGVWEAKKEALWYRAGQYFVHSVYVEEMDCYLASFLDTDKVNRGLGGIGRQVWLCVLLLWVAFAALLFVVNRGFIKPLDQFYQVIQHIRASGQRKLKHELKLWGCREIETIGEEFNGMLNDIDQMNKRILDNATALYEMEIQKNQAELAYLRSQIDPHFLYNTLEVIRQMALERGMPEIAGMALDMGKIFRYSAKGGMEVRLEEEISIIRSYVHIQQMRFSDKIKVHYFISQETLGIPVLKMLIQPLVENAISHGLEPMNREGSLYIGAHMENGNLKIMVKDDGVGIPADKLRDIRASLEEGSGNRKENVGIQNTNGRIRLYYGEGFGLNIESSIQDGTTVTMTLRGKQAK